MLLYGICSFWKLYWSTEYPFRFNIVSFTFTYESNRPKLSAMLWFFDMFSNTLMSLLDSWSKF